MYKQANPEIASILYYKSKHTHECFTVWFPNFPPFSCIRQFKEIVLPKGIFSAVKPMWLLSRIIFLFALKAKSISEDSLGIRFHCDWYMIDASLRALLGLKKQEKIHEIVNPVFFFLAN
ncbi:unnamed protein product [Meganyctiphanes norvegica]|uniref:Uncharacterized protein n=1 Tax=Meganyctiphanes norvegica TaxID=48144 RepID=A0AAV2Q2M4_MEGNR